MLNIFEEFTKNIESITPLRIGDKAFRINYDDEVVEEKVETLGFSIANNGVIVNGNSNSKYYSSLEEAKKVSVKARTSSIKSSIKEYERRISEYTKRIEDFEKELSELKS